MQDTDLNSANNDENALASVVAAIDTLLTKCKQNSNLVTTLYTKLLDELPGQVTHIENALNSGQYQAALDIAHKLNGSVKVCCLKELEQSADALEHNLAQVNLDNAAENFITLKNQVLSIENSRARIVEYLGKLPNQQKMP